MAANIVLTGASSFTGVWIAEALADAGFHVNAILRRPEDGYSGVRLDRVRRLQRVATVVFDAPFGMESFLRALETIGPIDALGHHAAQIEGYRSPDFDPVEALARNTHRASDVTAVLARLGARAMVLTGSVFEAGEGGDPEGGSVTPYGLSKTLTTHAWRYWSAAAGLRFGRLVIPSPYGPLEEPRFGWHLFSKWVAGETPQVRTPLYVRDHLPAPLVAKAYVTTMRRVLDGGQGEVVSRPSGWIASQGEFALRNAAEASRRLGRACEVELADQTDFSEPKVRINAEPVVADDWSETRFWDDYVGWYAELAAEGRLG